MKRRIFLISTTLAITLLSFSMNINHIRDDFHQAVTSECKLQAIIVAETYPTNQITKAYKGLATCTSAEFATWPTTKWKLFSDGKDMIEGAIKAAPTNPEIRYVRLMVQLNAPALVGYRDEIETDLNIFAKNIKEYSVASTWKTKFIQNLKSSDGITSGQQIQLTTLQTSINQ